MALGKRLREAREARDWTQEELARRSGVGQATISALETRDSRRSEYAGPLAEALGLSVEELTGTAPIREILTAQEQGRTYVAHATAEPEWRVPVVGTVQAGDDGYWEELQYPVGHGDGFVRYPSRDKNAYALRVKGDSMRPRIKPGEFILVEPNAALIPGEEVLVTTTDGRSMVKLLGPRRDGMIELQSINENHRPITLDETEIRCMHYVAAIVKPSRYYRDG